MPERGNPLTLGLDPASLTSSIVAVEAGRRTVARVLGLLCSSAAELARGAPRGGEAAYTIDNATLHQTSDALHATREFLSHVTDQLPSDEEQRWFISTLHALEHTIRLADAIEENVKIEPGTDDVDERRAVELCAKAMRSASSIATLLVHSPVPKSEEPRPPSNRLRWRRFCRNGCHRRRPIRRSHASNTVRPNWPTCCRYIAAQRSMRSRPAR